MYTLCYCVLALLAPAFWHALLTNTPAKVIAAAAVVSTFVQLVKRFAPSLITGNVAILLNLVASLSAVFVGMDTGQFWTAATFQAVVVIFTAAAGIHSTAKSLFKPSPATADPATPQAVSQARPQLLIFAFGLLGLAMLTGCKPVSATAPPAAPAIGAVDQVDQKANQDLQAIHAFLATVASQVQNGQLTLTADQLKIVDNADRAANVAQTAEKAYHAAGGGSASVLNAALQAAQAALTAVQSSLAGSISK